MHTSRGGAWRAPVRALAMSLHVVAACIAAYVASARCVELASLMLHRLGMARSDAVMAAVMAGFVGFCLILLWAFSRPTMLRTWIGLGSLVLVSTLALKVIETFGGRV